MHLLVNWVRGMRKSAVLYACISRSGPKPDGSAEQSGDGNSLSVTGGHAASKGAITFALEARKIAHERRMKLRLCVERRRRGRFWRTQVLEDYSSAVISHIFNGFIASVSGETVEPASASGVDERLLAAPLAHMCRIPRRVLATRPVAVAEHGAAAIRRNVRVLLRQSHGVRGPVVARVIGAVSEPPAP